MKKPTVVSLIKKELQTQLFSPADRERLNRLARIDEIEPDPEKPPRLPAETVACLTSWGSPRFTEEILTAAPDLKLVVYAAGSVRPVVSEALWKRGIVVTSASAAIAIGVAEHTLGLMLSTLKRVCRFNELLHQGGWYHQEERVKIREIYGLTVGVVGAGHAGRHFIRLLKNFEVRILLYDPYLDPAEAVRLGVEPAASLEALIPQVDVLSLHAPALPSTRDLINRENLKLFKDGALLINTARGALIDETALYEELLTGRLTACLDVRYPEPPVPEPPLWKLPNVILTPHIAGGVTDNMKRLGKYALRELENFFSGRPPVYPVTERDLERMA
ncbi:MAG TPA: hydroxyacid dehydrogenase [bacterium]|uniref:Glycerate dehydrogenase n=1 Tax=candidate division TA06 bacterium ADurb.Bin417 TaxID=1852828 RepID=A0A1V5MGE6_UNCT6|nr:MAG: Glycerate dehydrogenase [candidate division TA06 bacterium ADurb.Bin417]HNQ34667.1 hydroxyacid dehydrogenase [bacterium]HNS49016.1 hydroxyacid dehydrogenase [bacterium]